MTTATLPRRFMRPVATSPARRSLLIGFGATLAVGLLLIIGLSTVIAVSAGETVLRGVSVGGVNLAGLDRQAAIERLSSELPSLSTGQAVISVGDEQAVVPYADLGRAYELDAMVDAAFAVGRGGDPISDGIGRLRTLANPTTLPVIVHPYDAEALERVSGEISHAMSRPPVEAAVLRDGATFSVRASQAGTVVDAATIRDELAAVADTTSPDDAAISISAATVPPLVDTQVAEAALAAAEGMVADLALTIPNAAQGEDPLSLAAATIAEWISFGPQAEEAYTARLHTGAVTEAVNGFTEQVDQEPVNARISVASGGGLGGVVPGQDGRALNVEESVAKIVDALKQRAAGSSIASLGLAVDVTEPAYTTAQAEAALPRMEMVSSWTTYYVPGEGNGFGNNINIPAQDIDGRNLLPGEWFSFWGSVGPIIEERGFTYGGAIINGRSTQGVAIGGGICSTSTTIFNAALRAGLEMGVRLNHHYYIDRYPDGLDATVSIMDGWTQDMTFRNDTDNLVVVRGFGGNGSVTFQIWTVPTGRQIVITDPITSNHREAIDTTVVDSSMAPGTSRRVEYPHDGHDVVRSRIVYDANGNEIHRNTYHSHYATVNGIVAVGPSGGSSEATEEEATAEEPSDGGEVAVGGEDSAP